MKKLLPVLLLIFFMISFLGFTSKDNNTSSFHTFDTKKFKNAANELKLNSPNSRVSSPDNNKSVLTGDNWNVEVRSTLNSAGFNPDIFRPQEIFGTQAKEFTMPLDSNTDAMSGRIYNAPMPGSSYGSSVSCAGDVNGDGYTDIIIGAPDCNSHTGRVYIYYGGPTPNYTPDVVLYGEAPDNYFGNSVSIAGDVNGDGYADVIVGAYGNSGTRGKAYIFYGGTNMDNTADVILSGEVSNSNFGISVSGAGDVNGDGYADLIVGAYAYNSLTGRAYIYYGSESTNNTPDVILTGESTNNCFGYSVSDAGDVNGDGFDDVIVGAYYNNSATGKAYIYYGGVNMNSTADIIMTGELTNNRFGKSVSDAGDVNGDGFSDVIVGAYEYNSSNGRAYIFYGGVNMDNIADVIMSGETTNSLFGFSVSGAGDINGDGYSDVIVDAWGILSNTGKIYVFYGGTNMNNTSDLNFTGENANDWYGYFVSGGGDVNGDGYSDIIIGAPNYNSNTGRAYVYIQSMRGTDSPDFILSAGMQNSEFAYSVSDAGDINSDGYDDIIVGAYQYNINSGRAYIYFGGNSMNNTADVILNGAIFDYMGYSVSGAGDVNVDGYDDVIVGAVGYMGGYGGAFIYYGGVNMDTTSDVILTGTSLFEYFGCSVSGAGDVNGDGFDDVIVGAYAFNINTGKAEIFYGGFPMDNQPDVTLMGEVTGSYFGYPVSGAGDVNADGFEDVIVGAYGYDDNCGRAYVYFGGTNMNIGADVIMTGEGTMNMFGYSVSDAGDINSDGYDDVIVGAYNYLGRGKAYIYYGGMNVDNTADVTMLGEELPGAFGCSVSGAGDVNGDGYDDVIVGSFYYNSQAGKAYIFLGGPNMNYNSVADITMTGENPPGRFGTVVSGAGDLNGDGYSDLIVSEPDYNNNFGRAYVYLTTTPVIKPTLISVRDVPNDQGGYVFVRWARCAYDVTGSNRITEYLIEKSRRPVGGIYAWQFAASITPQANPMYEYLSPTWSDSTPIYFRVTAKTSLLTEFWRSNIMHGFSSDNLAPAQVKNLAGNMDSIKIYLHWKHNSDADLAKYRIYRNDILIAEKTDTTMNDFSVMADSIYKYRVSAVDIHGNEGIKSDSLQFTFGQMQLNLTVLIQGFYNDVSGLMVKDTVTVLLKNVTTPYVTIDSGKIVLDSLGQGTIKFSNAIRNGTYYVVVRHRNSIETWSTTGGLLFDKSINDYDFTTAITQAYGNNLILKGTKYCIISGDVDQDGSVGALDRSACWNDRNLSGYYATDLDGDGSVGALDRSICWNNRNLAVQKPALVASPYKGLKQDNKVDNDKSKGTYDLKLDGSNAKKVERTK